MEGRRVDRGRRGSAREHEGKVPTVCCDGDHSAEPLPVAVAESLMEYRAALDHFGPTWREAEHSYHPVTRLVPAPIVAEIGGSLSDDITMVDWLRGTAVLDGKARYPGTIVLRIDDDGHQCDVVGPRRALPGTTVRWDVLIDSRRSAPAIISTNGFAHQVPPGGAAVAQLRLTAGNTHGSLRIDPMSIAC